MSWLKKSWEKEPLATFMAGITVAGMFGGAATFYVSRMDRSEDQSRAEATEQDLAKKAEEDQKRAVSEEINRRIAAADQALGNQARIIGVLQNDIEWMKRLLPGLLPKGAETKLLVPDEKVAEIQTLFPPERFRVVVQDATPRHSTTGQAEKELTITSLAEKRAPANVPDSKQAPRKAPLQQKSLPRELKRR